MENSPRVLLADDHSLVVEGLRKLLEPEFEVVATVEDGRTLVTRALELRPDVVLVDISLPLLNGLEAARQIHKNAPEIKLVFVTMHADPDYVAEALRAGGSGYVLKQSAGTELVTAIRTVLRGGQYLTPLLDQASASGRELTSRQRQVLKLVAQGESNKGIAAALGISLKTVEFHKAAVAQRLGLRKAAEWTRYAIEHGIISG